MTRVLVVDDSQFDRRQAGGLLKTATPTWEIVYASDGQAALEQIELHLPDLVVTDLKGICHAQQPGICEADP